MVQAPPTKELILHEAGHATDPKFDRDTKLGTGLLIGGGLVGQLGGLASPAIGKAIAEEEDETKGKVIGGLATALGGAGLTYGGMKTIERTEDRANKFVKNYLKNELGDAKKAQEVFDRSPLPIGRQSYRRGTRLGTLDTLLSGGIGAGIGMGLVSLGGKKKDEKKDKETGVTDMKRFQ